MHAKIIFDEHVICSVTVWWLMLTKKWQKKLSSPLCSINASSLCYATRRVPSFRRYQCANAEIQTEWCENCIPLANALHPSAMQIDVNIFQSVACVSFLLCRQLGKSLIHGVGCDNMHAARSLDRLRLNLPLCSVDETSANAISCWIHWSTRNYLFISSFGADFFSLSGEKILNWTLEKFGYFL